MRPVIALRLAHGGRPLPLQLVTGRLAAFVSDGVRLNTDPAVPVKIWPGEIIGAPAAMVKDTDVAVGVVPPGPVAKQAAEDFGIIVVGMPETTPVSWSRASPAGIHENCRFVAGRSTESVRAMVALNAVPTLPVKVCPEVTTGTP